MIYEILIGGAFVLLGGFILPWLISKTVVARKLDQWWSEKMKEIHSESGQ